MNNGLNANIKLRRALASEWSAVNPILLSGEPGVELDTFKLKIGNGIDEWLNLAYVGEDKQLVVTANTHYDFPPIGDINIIYKALQEKQLYQWNEELFDYELIIDTNLYVTKKELQEAINNLQIPELSLEEYATKEYAQNLFNQLIPLNEEEILDACK